MRNLITKEGFEFSFDPEACHSCDGACCRGESGYVWVSKEEIVQIAQFLEMDLQKFIDRCLKKEGYRFTIKEIKKNGEHLCLFFDEKKGGCEIYPVRPQQCRSFPFWDQYKNRDKIEEVCKECKGIYPHSS